jgi:hypothetical protein
MHNKNIIMGRLGRRWRRTVLLRQSHKIIILDSYAISAYLLRFMVIETEQ